MEFISDLFALGFKEKFQYRNKRRFDYHEYTITINLDMSQIHITYDGVVSAEGLIQRVSHYIGLFENYRNILLSGGFTATEWKNNYKRKYCKVLLYAYKITIYDPRRRELDPLNSEEVENVLHALVQKCA